MSSANDPCSPKVSFRVALALLLACQILLLAAAGLPGRAVVFPHGNSVEVGTGAETDSRWINNRKFSDESIGFIPALTEQLQGNRSRWISTWNPHQQLGHPLPQLGGTSKAYLPTHALSLVVSDPLHLYSLLFIATLVMTGLFMFLFLHELSLLPVACFVGAMSLSFGVYFLYWATFLITVSGICWTSALLWLVTRYLRDRSLASAAGVSFSVYCLLLSTYPQQIVLFGYLLVFYTALALWKLGRPAGEKIRLGAALCCSVAIGVLASLPAYLDTYEAAQRATRLGADLSFFLAVLPRFESAGDVFAYAGKTLSPFWFGNPVQPDYPFHFNGVGFGFFALWLLVLSTLTRSRRLWFWYLFTGLCFLATVLVPVYVFMNRFMGFHFSRCIPTVGAVIPVVVLGSYAVDAMSRGLITKRTIVISTLATLAFSAVLSLTAASGSLKLIDPRFVLADVLLVAVIAGASIFGYTERGLVVASLLGSLVASQSLLLVRPPDTIRFSSPLVAAVGEYTTNGKSRFAKVGEDLAWFMPSAQEALYGTKSIHSYDSLSSREFQALAGRISGTGAQVFGRVFHVVDNEYRLCGQDTSLLGISLVLSKYDLRAPCLLFLKEVQGIKFYRPLRAPVEEIQTPDFSVISDGNVSMISDGGVKKRIQVRLQTAFDDRKVFGSTSAPEPTLLFLSEQYHPRWRAFGAEGALPVARVNGFFLGVLVPPYTPSVELRFEPHVVWSWIPQLFFLGVVLTVPLVPLVRRRLVVRRTVLPEVASPALVPPGGVRHS